MSNSHDQDLSLKLRFRRVLFVMGYYSPIEVELSHYEVDMQGQRKRISLTDLDVLGIKYDPVLTAHRVVGDCKSGKNASDPNRLFWLKGVSDYFGANVGYFLRPIIGSHARAIAPKLGLRVLDERELTEVERNLHVDKLKLPLADVQFQLDRERLWGVSVPNGVKPDKEELARKEVYSYLAYAFWYVEPHRNLFQLIDRFASVAHLLRPESDRDVLLAYIGLQRFAQCLLEMGSYIYSLGLGEVQRNARLYLYGGPLQLRDRQQLMHFIEELSKRRFDLDPPYLGEVLEVVNRMIHQPEAAAQVLIYLEYIYGWCVQLGNAHLESATPVVTPGPVVLARDMCIAFCKAAGLRENLYGALMAL